MPAIALAPQRERENERERERERERGTDRQTDKQTQTERAKDMERWRERGVSKNLFLHQVRGKHPDRRLPSFSASLTVDTGELAV